MEDDRGSLKKIIMRAHPKEESIVHAKGKIGKKLESPLYELIKGKKDLYFSLMKLEKR